MKGEVRMIGSRLLLLIVVVMVYDTLHAQCPIGKVVWDRVIFLREGKTVAPDQQLKELEGTLSTWEKGNCGEDSVKALLLQRVGFLHSLVGDTKGAVDLTLRSIAVISDHLYSQKVVPGHMVKSYFNLQILYDSLDLEGPKAAAVDTCIALMMRWRDGFDYGLALMARKAGSYYLSGDFYRCLEYCNLAERFIATAYPQGDRYSFLIWKMNVLHDMGRIQETEGELTAALRELRARNDPADRGAIFGLLLRVYADRGDRTMAQRTADSSIRLNRESHTIQNCASTLNNLGYYLYFRKLGDLQSALSCHRRSLAYKDQVESINTYDWMGVEFSEMGRHDSARHYFQLAFDALKKGADERTLLTHSVAEFAFRDNTEYVVNLILDKAAAYLRIYQSSHREEDRLDAMRLYRNADLVFEKMRLEQADIKSRLFSRKYGRSLFAQALEACHLSGDVKGAFYFMERSRSALLLEQLNEQALLNPDELQRLAAVKRHIVSLETQLQYLEPDATDALAVREQLVQEKLKLENMRRKVVFGNTFRQKVFADTSSIDVNNLRKSVMEKGTVWLELFTTDTAVYVLTVDEYSERLARIDGARFKSLVDDYLFRLSHRFQHSDDMELYRRSASALYDILFGHVDRPFNRVIASNDGRGIPLEGLWVADGKGKSGYLVEKAAVSYAFSATHLEGTAPSSHISDAGGILGLAPVNFPREDHLPALAGSDASLRQIVDLFRNGKVLTGREAVRAAFFRDYPHYRIAQLYTHGVDSSAFEEPLIYFADSVVRLSDLVLQEVPATKLVVLSACWTGTGELNPGEGVFSFSRGFAAMGIPSSLTNLWSVENQATYKITEAFYRHLAEGARLDDALRAAKLEFLASEPEERRQPNLWAALVLSGRTDPIPLSTPVHWPYWLAGVMVVAAVLYLAFRKKRPATASH